MGCELNQILVSAILGVGLVLGFVVIIWCMATLVWIKSAAVSLMKIQTRLDYRTNLERQ
jgi:hypothetical protein